ncbi:MAG: response regulator [Bacteroidales bacterium]|nr:response regulator [Bacteroidales bacterium]
MEQKYNWENKTIIIAEDVESNYQYLKAALTKTKINILWAKDGEEAINLFKNNKINMILMDIQMPVLNGLLATKAIKKIDKNVPIVAVTAYAMAGDREKSLAAGCDDYAAKPIRLNVLYSLIEKHLI